MARGSSPPGDRDPRPLLLETRYFSRPHPYTAVVSIFDFFVAVKDRITAQQDDSPEATLGDGCGFSQDEIDAAPQVEVAELEEGE